jgi:hypothetical protein
MATQLCPKCNKDSFTWRVDDEISEITIWNCSNCSYEAFEDEYKEDSCNNCEDAKIQLKDKNKLYWWCFTCNSNVL